MQDFEDLYHNRNGHIYTTSGYAYEAELGHRTRGRTRSVRLRKLGILERMVAYQHIDQGFDPVFNECSRILVLGSFPSVASRAAQFYYGNPRNRFWQVIAACLGVPTPPSEGSSGGDSTCVTAEQSIAVKTKLLLDGGIALWDVIESCDIKGSSDASIKNVVPADVSRILETAQINAVVCNGATAGRLYKRFLQWQVGLEAHVLPSTSPANAAWSTDRLIERWREELCPLLEAAKGEVTAQDAAMQKVDPARSHESRTSESINYAVTRVPTPPASNWKVHKSMQGNKRCDTKPELLIRERLRAAGLGGYRLQWKVPGHPDVAWPGKRVAVEIRGCFWHRCPHCNPSMPKKNVDYWQAKFARNVERDAENLAALQADGWRVHVIWECELKKRTIDGTMAKLLPELAAELGKELRAEPEAATIESAASKVEASKTESGKETEAEPPSKTRKPKGAKTKTETEGPAAGSKGKQNRKATAHPASEAKPESTRKGSLAEPTASAKSASPAAAGKSYYMYVIECADGSLYTGYTPDVQARFAAHQAGRGAKYTRGRGPLNLLANAEFPTKHDAMSAEARFKRLTRDQKDALLAKASKPDITFEQVLYEAFEM
jgi:hypoxanthine-DNA glycosylase